jgi:hypothetical protein
MPASTRLVHNPHRAPTPKIVMHENARKCTVSAEFKSHLNTPVHNFTHPTAHTDSAKRSQVPICLTSRGIIAPARKEPTPRRPVATKITTCYNFSNRIPCAPPPRTHPRRLPPSWLLGYLAPWRLSHLAPQTPPMRIAHCRTNPTTHRFQSEIRNSQSTMPSPPRTNPPNPRPALPSLDSPAHSAIIPPRFS